jgi:two-component system LytT family response regulator
MKIRTLIVDDEPWARKRIATLLRTEADVKVIGECTSAAEAIAAINSLNPDLVFLDIQMPGADGFEVLAATSLTSSPLFIFATAHDEYALRAFDAHAFDYLLKPFDEARFREALDRGRAQLRDPEARSKAELQMLLDSLRKHTGYLRRLAVKCANRTVLVNAYDIDWVQASGNYVTLHLGRNSYLVRTTITDFAPKLDPQQFVRIHRSTIVNLDRVREILPWFNGEQVMRLNDGTELTIGRTFRDALTRIFATKVG